MVSAELKALRGAVALASLKRKKTVTNETNMRNLAIATRNIVLS